MESTVAFSGISRGDGTRARPGLAPRAVLLDIGRIYMGNNAGLVLEFTTVLLRRYDPVHGVIYVVCVHTDIAVVCSVF